MLGNMKKQSKRMYDIPTIFQMPPHRAQPAPQNDSDNCKASSWHCRLLACDSNCWQPLQKEKLATLTQNLIIKTRERERERERGRSIVKNR